jgi:hypothetical protein
MLSEHSNSFPIGSLSVASYEKTIVIVSALKSQKIAIL